jgi:NAD(P)-dependent dehydrogenase (short-subunit alcohol dehydrogenase family)
MRTIDFTGKNAIVTGGARGLGKSAAEAVADCGANIWIIDILDDGIETAAEIAEKYHVKTGFSKADVTDIGQVKKFYIEAEILGKLDMLIHAAGIMENNPSLVSDAVFVKKITEVNLVGTFYVLSEGIKRMIPNRQGKIVAFSSVAGRRGVEIAGHYSATKAAIINYVRALSVEAGPYGINVNSVCPGNVRTDMFDGMVRAKAKAEGLTWDQALEYFNKPIPLGRAAQSEEVADAVLFLLSDLANYITGQALNVCGGLVQN